MDRAATYTVSANSFMAAGGDGLKERRTLREVAPGVTHSRTERGEQSEKDFYTVDVASAAGRAAEIATRLAADGYGPEVLEVDERAPDDPAQGPLGYRARTGAFATEAEANALTNRLVADGYAGTRVVHTDEDGKTRVFCVVRVLKVAPDLYDGTLAPELATGAVPARRR